MIVDKVSWLITHVHIDNSILWCYFDDVFEGNPIKCGASGIMVSICPTICLFSYGFGFGYNNVVEVKVVLLFVETSFCNLQIFGDSQLVTN